MAILRNDSREPRICPTLGFHEVAPGATITVADDEIEHWIAGGWVPADPATAKAAEDAAAVRAAAFKALTAPEPEPAAAAPTGLTAPAVAETAASAPAKPTKDSAGAAPEGKQP